MSINKMICLQNCSSFLHWSFTFPVDIWVLHPQTTTVLKKCLWCNILPRPASYKTCTTVWLRWVEECSSHQKHYFYQSTQYRTFTIGDPVWLSIPTAGKLESKWEGEWVIQSVQSPVTYKINDGRRTKIVHINY